jgi:hypothetical protein
MTKSLLISQPSSRLVNVLNGIAEYLVVKKVNKDVLDKLNRGETVDAYLYCTKGKPIVARYESQVFLDDIWIDTDYLYETTDKNDKSARYFINGTIPVKVVIDGYDTYYLERPLNLEVAYRGIKNEHGCEYSKDIKADLIKHSGLTFTQLFDYGTKRFDGQQSVIKALHISKVEILDEVMKLGDFYKSWSALTCGYILERKEITRPPQNCMSVWVK